MPNNRIKPIEGNVVKELMSPETFMYWDPVTNDGHVRFQCYEYIISDEVVVAKTGQASYKEIPLADIATEFYGTGLLDPVSGQPLDGISGLGVMQLFKVMFDRINNPPEPEVIEEPEPEPEEPIDPEVDPEE